MMLIQLAGLWICFVKSVLTGLWVLIYSILNFLASFVSISSSATMIEMNLTSCCLKIMLLSRIDFLIISCGLWIFCAWTFCLSASSASFRTFICASYALILISCASCASFYVKSILHQNQMIIFVF